MKWLGVMPAITTAFDPQLHVDHAFMARHARWMLANGCTGIIPLGSLGEAATLSHDEKIAALKNLVRSVGDNTPVIAAISALSTAGAVALAQSAQQCGCSGLMVLPPYVYRGDWRETKSHMSAIFAATNLDCMLYNNPVAYVTDFLPEQIAELSHDHKNLVAVKESSTDVRRITAIRALLGNRLKIFVGVDDAIVEGIAAGAVGWVAGLVNAFPRESVLLFDHALNGRDNDAAALYRWFLPLLRMDTVPKFVQLIKLAQQQAGVGSASVRAPRMQLTGSELESARETIHHALATRPATPSAVPWERA
jgi:4-hydroxy-tetrahydrodipicolinate synthase